MHFYYILPLLAGLIYTISALFAKKAIDLGSGSMRITFLSNITGVILFLPFLIIDPTIHDPSHWWAPVACGILKLIGMSFTFAALRVGEVSILTPLLGFKIFFVAILITLLYQTSIPLAWWVAASLAVSAIALFGTSKPKHVCFSVLLKTLLLAIGCTFSFALCDVIMAKEAADFGEPAFLVSMCLCTALLSFGFIPFFRGSFMHPPAGTWRWIILSAILMVLVEILFYGAVAFFGNPTAMNILYSSRGIWGIVLVWTIGHWFKNSEKEIGHSMMRRRLLGAVLLFLAIVLVLGSE